MKAKLGPTLKRWERDYEVSLVDALIAARGASTVAIGLDPTLADAHFNLAQLHQQAGDERGALRHYSAYRRLQR